MSGLDNALKVLQQKYGTGTVNKMKDMNVPNVKKFSSGSLALDLALGGGYPEGRIIEIYGPESSGKTTLCLHALAEVQKQGKVAAFIDAEHALDPEYAKDIGVDVENMVFAQPDSGEQALDILDELLKSGEIGIAVVDSVAALVPRKELDGDMGDSSVGVHARLMSQAMRKITGTIHKTGATVIFINQIREKIGVMFGSPETTTGGNALKFYASQRLDIRKQKTEKNKEGDSVSNRVKITVKKNKVAPPFRIAETMITFGIGVDKAAELISIGVELDVLDKRGAMYDYDGTNIGRGLTATIEILRDNEELCALIEADIRKALEK